jgi:LacI family transcriptional regulator
MKRPTIADLASAAELSISTVDRVLNGRDPVRRATADRVLAAAERIGFRAATAIRHRLTETRPERTFGFVLQQRSSRFYQLLGEALTEATRASADIRGRARVDYLDDLSAAAVAERLLKLGRSVDALAVVAAEHPRITAAIAELKERGVPVFALISDLTAPLRAGYIGLDNWKVGRTAAWFIANMAKRPGRVGILVGSHRYRCQDECEMSFRSYFREHAPDFQLMEPLVSLEDDRYAYEATLDLIARAPDLTGLYLGGGGSSGAVRALQEADAGRRMIVVGLDMTDESRSDLIDGVIKVMLGHPLGPLAAATIQAMVRATDPHGAAAQAEIVVPMEIFTAENV